MPIAQAQLDRRNPQTQSSRPQADGSSRLRSPRKQIGASARDSAQRRRPLGEDVAAPHARIVQTATDPARYRRLGRRLGRANRPFRPCDLPSPRAIQRLALHRNRIPVSGRLMAHARPDREPRPFQPAPQNLAGNVISGTAHSALPPTASMLHLLIRRSFHFDGFAGDMKRFGFQRIRHRARSPNRDDTKPPHGGRRLPLHASSERTPTAFTRKGSTQHDR